MKFFFPLIIVVSLTSCTSQDDVSKGSVLSQSPGTVIENTGVILKNINNNNESSTTKNIEELTVEEIKNIKTMDDLAAVYPGIQTSAQKNHKDFIELHKNQLLLMAYTNQIDDPEYTALEDKLKAIQDGRELWTPEMILAEKEYQALVNPVSGVAHGYEAEMKLQKINILIMNLSATKEYQAYLQKSQTQIMEINAAMKKYWTPEMIELEKNWLIVSKEIYGGK